MRELYKSRKDLFNNIEKLRVLGYQYFKDLYNNSLDYQITEGLDEDFKTVDAYMQASSSSKGFREREMKFRLDLLKKSYIFMASTEKTFSASSPPFAIMRHIPDNMGQDVFKTLKEVEDIILPAVDQKYAVAMIIDDYEKLVDYFTNIIKRPVNLSFLIGFTFYDNTISLVDLNLNIGKTGCKKYMIDTTKV